MSRQSLGYPAQELKNQINNLSEARENIDQRKNISDSMVKLNKTLTNIDPLLKKQDSYIKNFFSQQSNTSAKQKQSSARRYINRICEIITRQVHGLFDAGQKYFTIDFKSSWGKISKSFQKDLADLREQTDQNNIIEFLFKILNVKDFLMNQFIKSFIYRKCLLFKDLNIIESGFVHSEKKQITKLIQEYMVERGYIPTRPQFQWPGFQVNGEWNLNKMINSDVNMKDLFVIADQEIQQVINVIRNFAHLNQEQREHEDIKRNVKNVKSLRQQIEQAKYQYAQLQKKYQQASSRDQKSADTAQLRETVNSLTQALEEKEIELRNLKSESSNTFALINTLNNKVKQLQSDVNRLTDVEMKKLKEIEMIQKSLNDEFVRIYKNTSNFGAMFEFESHGKQSLAKEIMSKQKTIEKLVDILGRERMKNREMQDEITRLNTIILQLGDKIDKERSSLSD